MKTSTTADFRSAWRHNAIPRGFSFSDDKKPPQRRDGMATKTRDGEISTLLAIPSSFRMTALSFPDKVQQALALVETAEQAAELLDKAEVMSQFARRVRADTECINAIQGGKLLIIAKLGELLPKGEPGRPKKGEERISKPGLGISGPTVTQYRKVASASDKIEEYREAVEAKNAELPPDSPEITEVSTAGFLRFVTGGVASSLVASEENEWYTPKKYLDAARAVLEQIDLDPASSTSANATVKAKRFYSSDDGSLEKTWEGRVWLNPPYGRLAGAFAKKLLDEYAAGNVKAAIILVNAHCTDTDWFQGLWDHLLCFTDHRIDFDSAGREKTTSSTHGSVFVYLGRRNTAFVKAFAAFGAVVKRA